ncbi:MAG: TetR/AcrR family transcriptional regulator [Rhodospirillales bacterium]
MPWEKQFDEDKVLDKAMRAFWLRGFKGTSMKDLVAETGLNPGSIYAAFKDKEHLFQLCLAKYEEQTTQSMGKLENTYSPRDAILSLFDTLIAEVDGGGESCGCFIMNSVLEAGPQDDEVTQIIQRSLAQVETLICNLIRKGQEVGEISADVDPGQTARLIQGLLAAARLMARAKRDHPFIKESREHAENLLS